MNERSVIYLILRSVIIVLFLFKGKSIFHLKRCNVFFLRVDLFSFKFFKEGKKKKKISKERKELE